MYGHVSETPRVRHIGREIREFDSVDSTQLAARRLLQTGAASGTVVTAREQTSGRGRLGRVWLSPRGAGVYLSVILRTGGAHAAFVRTCAHRTHNTDAAPLRCARASADGAAVVRQYLSLAAGVAVMEVLRRRYGLPALIKWPNDIFIHGRKVCGILVEGIDRDALILGIGVNTNMKIAGCSPDPDMHRVGPKESIPAQATSLSAELRRDIDHSALLSDILEALDIVYGGLVRGLSRFVIHRVRRHLYGLSREVCFDAGGAACSGVPRVSACGLPARGASRNLASQAASCCARDAAIHASGIFEGVDDEGRALVRTGEGRVCAVTSGEVRIMHTAL